MALSLQGFSTLVQNMASAVQSSCASLLNFNTGSVVRAIQEANASVALWLQWLILQVLSLTRLATSNGTDVDSWVADFSLTRLPAVAASGPVTFSRYQTTIATLIPVGANVKTSDGTRIFTVIADATNPAWNGSTGFTLPSGTASLVCTVLDITTGANGALAIGMAGNVQAGTINLLASSISGVDTVTNAAPFVNGIDAESDANLRARFSNYIQTRSRATLAAIGVAIGAVQQGLNWTIQENVNSAGVYTPGWFVVTVDDGSGAPPASLISAVSLAISAYRPIGSVWAVQAPSVITATITMTITTDPAGNKPGLLLPVENAILAYVDALPDGAILPYSRLAMIAYVLDRTITDVTAVLLNGGTADIVPTAGQVVKATAASVTIT
jgi:Baseplate J-like protein